MLVSSLALAAMSCKVEIKDAEWCFDMGPLGAHCFYSNSNNERDLSKEQWDKERFGMACTSSDNLAEIIKVQLKLCNRTKSCRKEIKTILENAEKKMQENEVGIDSQSTAPAVNVNIGTVPLFR